VFEREAGKPVDHPDFEVARRFWQEILSKQKPFINKKLQEFKEVIIPLGWLDGPDQLHVRFKNDPEKLMTGCFLNINAEDFGIEVDKIARIHLGDDVVLCDGELIGDRLLNAPVGLFEVDRLCREIDECVDYHPDLFFWSGQLYEKDSFPTILNGQFLPYIMGLRKPGSMEEYDGSPRHFDLCPVTRRIIKRYLAYPQTAAKSGNYDVFISVGGEDVKVADAVHTYLTQNHIKAFYYREPHSDSNFLRIINQALDSASCLVAVGSKPENLERPFVEFELNSFFYDILTIKDKQIRGKKQAKKMISYISDAFHPAYLPRPLRLHTCIKYKPTDYKSGLPELLREYRAESD
jgi:hypothetical protein